jgi:hypothetical protein
MGYFVQKNLLVVTRHQKERVLRPLFSEHLGCTVLEGIEPDTDSLGTFSGEVARSADMLTTARKKAELGVIRSNADLILVTEGSFGPHPQIPFVAANTELIFLYEPATERNWYEVFHSTETNFASTEVSNWAGLQEFVQQAAFPEHGIILRPAVNNFDLMLKGICCIDELKGHAQKLFDKYGRLWAETDMRAHMNPMRMKVIEKAAKQLIQRLKSNCEACGLPGFGLKAWVRGLPCAWCQRPTSLALAEIHACDFCEKEQRHNVGEPFADPGSCNYCNP